jgi:hypothetical protein
MVVEEALMEHLAMLAEPVVPVVVVEHIQVPVGQVLQDKEIMADLQVHHVVPEPVVVARVALVEIHLEQPEEMRAMECSIHFSLAEYLLSI